MTPDTKHSTELRNQKELLPTSPYSTLIDSLTSTNQTSTTNSSLTPKLGEDTQDDSSERFFYRLYHFSPFFYKIKLIFTHLFIIY